MTPAAARALAAALDDAARDVRHLALALEETAAHPPPPGTAGSAHLGRVDADVLQELGELCALMKMPPGLVLRLALRALRQELGGAQSKPIGDGA